MKKIFNKKIVVLLSFVLLIQCISAQSKNYSNWMSENLDYNRSLSSITLPGAHDATIYQCFDCTIGANVENTQTQYLPIEQLLDSGIRYFDIRPIYDDGGFYTGHYTKYHKRPSFGCKGDSLQRVLRKVNDFLSQHNELVILHFSHYCDRKWNKKNTKYFSELIQLVKNTLGETVFKMQDTLQSTVATLPLNKIITGKQGKVILIFNDYNSEKVSNKAGGIFSFQNDLSAFDRYSNTTDLNFMQNDQRKKFALWSEKASTKKENIFIMPLTLTQNTKTAMRCSGFKMPWKKSVSIMQYAQTTKNELDELFESWTKDKLITAEKKPNIINVDIADGVITRLCIRLNKLE
jgi:hypothetical protein